jgi:hypothetical protein
MRDRSGWWHEGGVSDVMGSDLLGDFRFWILLSWHAKAWKMERKTGFKGKRIRKQAIASVFNLVKIDYTRWHLGPMKLRTFSPMTLEWRQRSATKTTIQEKCCNKMCKLSFKYYPWEITNKFIFLFFS